MTISVRELLLITVCADSQIHPNYSLLFVQQKENFNLNNGYKTWLVKKYKGALTKILQ